jgi:GNAT superfamily N-acetyltransferase
MFQEAMNPLSISQERLLVAFDDNGNYPEMFLGFGQIRPLTTTTNQEKDNRNVEFSELASLYVFPEYRRQGVGGALVDELLQRHDASSSSTPTSKVCLLTLRPTVPFFQAHGFSIADDEERAQLPSTLQFEYTAGSILSAFLKNDLVCMIRR